MLKRNFANILGIAAGAAMAFMGFYIWGNMDYYDSFPVPFSVTQADLLSGMENVFWAITHIKDILYTALSAFLAFAGIAVSCHFINNIAQYDLKPNELKNIKLTTGIIFVIMQCIIVYTDIIYYGIYHGRYYFIQFSGAPIIDGCYNAIYYAIGVIGIYLILTNSGIVKNSVTQQNTQPPTPQPICQHQPEPPQEEQTAKPPQEKIFYMTAANGMVVRVPESKLESWSKAQEELRNNPNKEPSEEKKRLIEEMKRKLMEGSDEENIDADKETAAEVEPVPEPPQEAQTTASVPPAPKTKKGRGRKNIGICLIGSPLITLYFNPEILLDPYQLFIQLFFVPIGIALYISGKKAQNKQK